MGQEFSLENLDTITFLENRTHYSRDELTAWHTKFFEEYPDGEMSFDGFIRWYKKIYTQGESTDFAKHMFRAFDTDGHGTLDFRKFMISLSVTQKGTNEEKLKWAFKMCDINGDKSISREEAMDVLKALYKMNGVKDEREAEKIATKLFVEMDTDRSGELDEEEFVKGITKLKIRLF